MGRSRRAGRPDVLGGAAGKSPDASPAVDIDQYGRGEYDPVTGLFEWYEVPPEQQARIEAAGERVTWGRLLDLWGLVEADLQDRGIDVDDRALMGARSWRWLRTRIRGLLSTDSRTARALAPRRSRR